MGTLVIDLNGDGTAGPDESVEVNSAGESVSTDGITGEGGALERVAIVGDWNGNGVDDIGLFVSSSSDFQIDLDGNLDFDTIFDSGVPGDIPVVGNWDGDIGTFDPSTGNFKLDLNGNLLS